MGLISALKDQCRWVRNEPTGERVYGQPKQTGPVKGPWIKCRLDDTGGASGSSVDDDARRRYRKAPSIMINKTDSLGAPIDLRPGETIEVRSAIGDSTWMIEGGLRTIRGRNKPHHYEAVLARVTDDAEDPGDVL